MLDTPVPDFEILASEISDLIKVLGREVRAGDESLLQVVPPAEVRYRGKGEGVFCNLLIRRTEHTGAGYFRVGFKLTRKGKVSSIADGAILRAVYVAPLHRDSEVHNSMSEHEYEQSVHFEAIQRLFRFEDTPTQA